MAGLLLIALITTLVACGSDTGAPKSKHVFIIASGGSTRAGRIVSPGPGHAAIPPTVLKHLGLAIKPDWDWESEPFGL